MKISRTALLDRLDSRIAQLRNEHAADGPGFCIALVADGELQRQVQHGMAHLEWPQPIAGDTRFYLASEAKPWVAALTMDLVASQRIELDTDVRPLLPALAPYEHPVQLGHLLRHTSGIPDYLFLWHLQLGHHETDVVTQAQALELIRRAEHTTFVPGSRYEYSNSNYVLLAELLKHLEGRDLAELARSRYFEPWGMRDSSFEDDPWRVMPRRARSYERAADGSGDWTDAPVPLGSWGDGGLWSTPNDLVRAERGWQAAWAANPGGNALARCCEEDARFAPAGLPYRFGVEVADLGGRRLVFHGGAYAAFSSLVLRAVDDAVSLIVLSNLDGFDSGAEGWTAELWNRR